MNGRKRRKVRSLLAFIWRPLFNILYAAVSMNVCTERKQGIVLH